MPDLVVYHSMHGLAENDLLTVTELPHFFRPSLFHINQNCFSQILSVVKLFNEISCMKRNDMPQSRLCKISKECSSRQGCTFHAEHRQKSCTHPSFEHLDICTRLLRGSV